MPKEEAVARAVEEIGKGYAQYQYFFANLNSPAWLEPLHRRGFFQKPRDPDREGDYVKLAIWPESKYLVRMAKIPEAQAKVLEITLGIPYSENSRVHDDVADIALALPPALAAKLVPQICRYTESPIKLLLYEKVADLIVHLARGGQAGAALELAGAALALDPDPRTGKDGEKKRVTAEPRARFRDWYYVRIIHKALPALVDTAGPDAVSLFGGLLNDAARLSFAEEPDEDEDYFYVRQPAIELGCGRDDIPSFLLCATRDAAAQVVSRDPASFVPVLKLLQRHKWISFRRLELHISRAFLEQGIATAEKFFSDPKILDHRSLRHEAILLLRDSFPRPSPETQQGILAWMDAGPSDESIQQFLEFANQPVTKEEIARVKSIRRRNRFAILEGQLPAPYQQTYEALVAELGPADQPDRLPIRTFSQIGAKSPKSSTELAAMTTNDVIEFLASWKPGGDIFAPTADGLGGALTSTVVQRPVEFIAIADRFKTLDPTYVRSFFAGLSSALKNGAQLNWKPVLELAAWVTALPRRIEGRKGGGLLVADPDWGWTRDSIIDLLKAGFEGGEGRLPYEHRELVWGALVPLTDDPFPSMEDERGEKFDPSFLSINCTRGRAMYAVMDYARWVRDCANACKRPEEPPVTLNVVPEVRELLERHLDIRQEPRLTIRSVYGIEVSSLANLDLEWFRANVERIFPLGPDESAYFNAAWESFVVYNQPHAALLREMIPGYRKAIADLGAARMMHSPGSPDDGLADHLMAYYWWGQLKFDSEDHLLEDFYKRASDPLRAHVMWFVGRSATGWNDDAPTETFERLRSLMDSRLKAAEEAASPTDFMKELAGFGWLFTSEKFDEAWSIQTLLRVLQLTKKIDDGMDVIKRLADLSPKHPKECMACFALMVEGDREGWVIVGVEADTHRAVKAALDSGKPEAVNAAKRLAELLIGRGNYGFRELLS